MKILKILIIFIIFSTIPLFFVLYDLASFDSKYINRDAIYFSKTNLNSKKSEKIFNYLEKLYYKVNLKFSDEQKNYWKIDNIDRSKFDKYKIIKGQTSGFRKGLNLKEIEIPKKNWLRSHGNSSSVRFSNLKEINAQNVKKLALAWRFNSGDGKKGIQANPIAKNGKIFFPTPGNFIVCLDGSNGEVIWKYKVKNGSHAAKRGLMIWTDKNSGKDKIIFSNDDELIMLNAENGQPSKNFGRNGIVKTGSSPMTPVIIDNQIIIGTTRPAIESYNIESGKVEWKYYLRKFNNKTLNSGDFEGGNPWGGISADKKTKTVFLTTGNAHPYFVGVMRPGKNLYANSIIAFDLIKKDIKWYFQETCHDIWNFDIAAPPVLTTLTLNKERVDVVVAFTKLGNTIILNRDNGRPIFDYRKKIAPSSKLPGEKTCLYQPDLNTPEPFYKSEFSLKDITNINEEENKFVKNLVKDFNYGFFPTHEINKPTLVKSLHGGATWTGASVNSKKNIAYVTSNNMPDLIEVYSSKDINKDFKVSTNGMKQKQLFDSKGYPGVKMPWGALTSIDLNKGKIIWQVPLGNFEELKHITDTGTLNYGGATASAGDLVFASGTLDKKIRAFDSNTGEVLWSYKLPYIGSAPPTIYEAKGEQYLMIPATGSWSLKNVYPELVEYGDAFLAFKIKK